MKLLFFLTFLCFVASGCSEEKDPLVVNDYNHALGVTMVSANSLYWPRIYKSSDPRWERISTTKEYFVLYSTDHESPNGGIYWGEFDSFKGHVLEGFVERGPVVKGNSSETPELQYFPSSKTGMSDEIFLFFHTDATDSRNIGGKQETHLISTSGGELHKTRWRDRGKPFGLQPGENHTGYVRVHKRCDGDYVAIHLAVAGIPGVYKYSISSNPTSFKTRSGVLDETSGMPGGDSYLRSQIHPFTYNGNLYGFIGYIKTTGESFIAVATLDENRIPTGLLKTIVKADNLRNFETFIEPNGIAYFLWKKGSDNSDNGFDYEMISYDLKDLNDF